MMAALPNEMPAQEGDEPVTAPDAFAQPKEGDSQLPTKPTKEGGNEETVATENTSIETDDEASPDKNAHVKLNDHGTMINGVEGTGPNGDVNGDALSTAIEGLKVGEETEKKKKKKKKKKPASRKNITGWEEFYADSPITPADAALEKQELYQQSRPLDERIEECLQRYRARRKWDPERTNIFNKYLFLGGIDTSQRQFTGHARDYEALAEADAEQIRDMTAVDFVGHAGSRFYDPGDSENWEIDFAAIVKGFLSRSMTGFIIDHDAIQKAADVIKNFLNYVLMHDVCPEYKANIMEARAVCDTAPGELQCVRELSLLLPGTFNDSARLLFCDGLVDTLTQAERFRATVNFRLAVLVWNQVNLAAKQALMSKGENEGSITVIDTKENTYKVVEIVHLRRKQKQLIEEQVKTAAPAGHEVHPIGFVKMVPSYIEQGYGNAPRFDESTITTADDVIFFLEEEILPKLEVGMKLEMVVCELSIGISFIKEVSEVRVSFDTLLPQHLMKDWKEPVPNSRPARSVHDPEIEYFPTGDGDDFDCD